MLELTRISKVYDNGVRAVNDLSLTIEDGEIFGFIGPNGAGKTTTIKMIVGLLKPDEGEVLIDGVDMWDESIEAKSLIAYVPDQPVVYDKLSGIEYLNFIGDIYSVSSEDRERRIKKYTKIFRIESDLDKLLEEYSHGMKQKLLLTGALLHDPKLLILDEPMVGLDPKSAYNLKEIMKERCKEGKSVFFSTHVLEVAENLCDKIGIISKGNIIKVGKVENLREGFREDESLEEIFLELTEDE